MDLKETIKFLKNGSEEDIEKFIQDKMDYLSKNDVARRNDNGLPLSIKTYHFHPAAFRTYIDKEVTKIYPTEDYPYYFDITHEIFKIFTDELKQSDNQNIQEICKIVSKVVFDYFGGRSVQGTLDDRFSRVKDLDDLEEGEKNYISSFKNTSNAWCVERATTVHQIFKMLGIDSQVVISPIENDGKQEYHAFNMIRGSKNTILLDTTMIDYSKPEEGYDSIVDILPYESFDTVQNIPERNLVGRNGQQRSCKINPQNTPPAIIDSNGYHIPNSTKHIPHNTSQEP